MGNAPTFSSGVIIVDPSVEIPDTQLVTLIDPLTGEIVVLEQPVQFGPGKAVGLLEIDGVETYKLVGAFQDTGSPHNFLGFQINVLDGGNIRPVVTTSRGAMIVDPVVSGGEVLDAGVGVFLSIVPGEVTQNPEYFDYSGAVYYRVGFAVSGNKIALAPDHILRL